MKQVEKQPVCASPEAGCHGWMKRCRDVGSKGGIEVKKQRSAINVCTPHPRILDAYLLDKTTVTKNLFRLGHILK